MSSEDIARDVLLHVVGLLEKLGIRYALGGSYASGIHGVPRPTGDADLVVDITESQAKLLADSLTESYYADAQMMIDALRHEIAFNIIHLASGFKIDFFPVAGGDFKRSELVRRTSEPLGSGHVYVTTAEDTLLAKLSWFRQGGEVSDRQWKDILGIIEVKGSQLEMPYLRLWASRLEVDELLDRAFSEAQDVD